MNLIFGFSVFSVKTGFLWSFVCFFCISILLLCG